MNSATITLPAQAKDYSKFDLKNAVDVLTKDVKEKVASRSGSHKTKSLERSIAASLGSTVKASFTPEMLAICESYHNTKLTTRFRNVARKERGREGTRSLFLSKYGKELVGFEFNSSCPFKKTFKAKYHIKQGSRKGQVIVHFPSFIPDKSFKRSSEATNFKINAKLIALSDFTYDHVAEDYFALNNEFHGEYSSYDSGMLPILKMPMDPKTSQLCVDQKALPSNVTILLVMSLTFYKYENGMFKHLDNEGCMQIKQVF